MEKQLASCLKISYNDLKVMKIVVTKFCTKQFSTSDNQIHQNKENSSFPNNTHATKALLAENLPVGTSPGAAAVPIFAGMCSLLEKNIHSHQLIPKYEISVHM